MTTILRIRNTVHDVDEWKAVFDEFDRFRADHGVRAYRVLRPGDDEGAVEIDFDSAGDAAGDAAAFGVRLARVWGTPQSRARLVAHEAPVVVEVVAGRSLAVPP